MSKRLNPEVYNLASDVLDEVPAKASEKNIRDLAFHIQQLIEDWMENELEDNHV